MSESRMPLLRAATATASSFAIGLSAVLWAGPASRSVFPGAALSASQAGATASRTSAAGKLPRTADGKPNLQGIWQVRNRAAYDLENHDAKLGMPAGRSVVEGGEIPYQPWAAAKKGRRIFRHARRPIRSRSATCPACRASCTWNFRSRFFRRATTSRSPSSGRRSSG